MVIVKPTFLVIFILPLTIDKDHREHFRPTGVMSTVLYSGDRTWHQPHSLLDRILVPEPLKGLMNTWKGNIHDIKEINVELLRNEKVKSLVSAVQTIYRWNKDTSVNVNINFTKNVSLSFTSFGCFAHLPLSLISCLLFYRTFL